MKHKPLALKQIARLTKVKPGRLRVAGAALANSLLRFFVTKLKPVPTKVTFETRFCEADAGSRGRL
ncbi:MAG: hypothetical protein DRJ10_00710 [Bacteroidetes bacterium]|nr:MAG: hypothetical protein DRI89_02110 [Bacteroidota bacterium]RLD84619.1 MAG: hypothetical protein DRJ10_00710 [Bacteroidota bacterium]